MLRRRWHAKEEGLEATPEPRAARHSCDPPAGAARGPGAANLGAHLQPGQTAGMASFWLLRLALALLLLTRPSDSSVILAYRGRLVEGKGMALVDSGDGTQGFKPFSPLFSQTQ